MGHHVASRSKTVPMGHQSPGKVLWFRSNCSTDLVIDALNAHHEMSSQDLNSAEDQAGLKDVLMEAVGLYERLRRAS